VWRHHLPGEGAPELVRRPSNAEIGQRWAEARTEEVGWFDVAVDDAGRMSRVQGFADLDANLENVIDG